MKLIGIIVKGIKEQVRSFWVLFLSLSMGPFFIFVYFLITESSKTQYTVLVVNADRGVHANDQQINYGENLISHFTSTGIEIHSTPFVIRQIAEKKNGMVELKSKRADALIIIPELFSQTLQARVINDSLIASEIEFIGDLTDIKYLISAVWAGEIINEFTLQVTSQKRMIEVKETALGTSGSISEFNMLVPGILIVSIIMLMFTASIAFVSEIEYKTILRLKLSKLTAIEFLGGIGIVQLLVGLASVVLSLGTAILLGFQYAGSLTIMLFIAGLTSLSIIAFSLIIAALTKSANEVLVVGNFPMFLFMFFTGAAFPLKSNALFTIAGYPITIQGLMTPTHAISALNKTLILNLDFISIVPEIIVMMVLSIVYVYIGVILFKLRHLKLT
ncbi:MAG: ABC transporter permease [Bacteroidota bacterium]